jgi:transcriptional regulator with XRE-family HTH domain
MDEVDAGEIGGRSSLQPGTTPRTVGQTLRAAREAQGLSLAEVGARTRVPLRHLEAIEAADYTTLPSPTYAVGFARAYARTVGADEVAIAHAVRGEVDRLGVRHPEYQPYAVADPARVPSRGLTIVAAGVAMALLVLVAVYFGGDWMRRPAATPLADAAAMPAAARAVPRPAPAAATASGAGEVVLTANDEVWMRVYDAANATLYIGTLQPGARFVVPGAADAPKIDVGRPDKLKITLDGKAVPPLGTGERPVKSVGIGPAALAARLAATPVPTPLPVPVVSPTPLPSASPSPPTPIAATGPRRRAQPARQRPRRVLTETQRANLEALRNPPRARNQNR